MNCRHILEIHEVLGQRSFWANENKALIEGALFEIGQKKHYSEGKLFVLSSKRALNEDLGSFSLSTDLRIEFSLIYPLT